MAMLAEPRQRKRYNLVPRGKALYEDDSRFGTKMLEKMGWKKGEGLGANSEGSKDFVRIRYKNDAYGLGFEQRDDQWTEHEQSFNGLLSSLNSEESGITKNKENQEADETDTIRVGFGFQNASSQENTKVNSGKMKEKISGISLEEKSKQSKARVHYKKFTRGKDLAQYSEKDLANIFGKKAVDEEQEANAFYKNLNEVFGVITEETNDVSKNGPEAEPEKTSKKKDKKKKKKDQEGDELCQTEISEEKTDIQPKTYTSNLSVQDYFKMKMEAFQNRKTIVNNQMESQSTNCPSNDEHKDDLKKLKKKRKKETQVLENDCSNEPVEKKTKKSKKQFDQDSVPGAEVAKGTEVTKKVKKSDKREESNEFSQETKSKIDDANNCLEDPKAKKLKEIADITDQNDFLEKSVQNLDFSAEKKSKKNKKSRSENQEKTNTIHPEENAETISKETVTEIVGTQKSDKRKSKKNKTDDTQQCLTEIGENEISKKEDEKFLEKNKHKTEKANDSLCVKFGSTDMELDESESKSRIPDVKETFAIVDLTKESKRKKKNKKDINVLNNVVDDMDETSKERAESEIINKPDECNTEPVKKKSRKTDLVHNQEDFKENEKLGDTKTKKENYSLSTNIDTAEVDVEESKSESLTRGEVKYPIAVVDLTKESTKKMKKKNKKNIIETNEVVHLVDDSDNEKTSEEEKHKSIKGKDNSETIEDDPITTTGLSDQPAKKTKTELSPAENDASFQDMDLEELKQKYQAFNRFTISTFCAEKFRNINAYDFKGSTLTQIEGYGLNQNIQLDIQVSKKDERRISDLWMNAFNKYDQTNNRKKDYKSYLRQAFKARKTNKKPPPLHIKSWQRKNAFQIL